MKNGKRLMIWSYGNGDENKRLRMIIKLNTNNYEYRIILLNDDNQIE